MSASEIKTLVVDGFPLSTRRSELWGNFIDLTTELKSVGITCDVWIDGSFLTQKIEPDDVDFVIDVPISILSNLTPTQKALIEKITIRDNTGLRKTKNLHGFVMFNAPAHHPNHIAGVLAQAQWQKDFGFSYIKKLPKGIAVMEVSP